MKTMVAVSGYFNPLHAGHIRYLKCARELGDELVVIVNNDRQQILKKGKIITPEDQRMEVVRELRCADHAVLALDEDRCVSRTLEKIADDWPDCRVIFGNGGDRQSEEEIPETEVCQRRGIELRFGVGGNEKVNSSSNINKLLGQE